ncbi:hypothetical protein CEUSTIGMA_g13177.t1 [Chlamydomonas eustigma]|uniref:Anaphase-promoting complex subunit 4 WD40 domain-containing protein n=1 Tax=Chlamydomonas eustigma TaxID=1157962 RepID=A0A250XS53_9CHLO|nr:hypothetical protein CEUSTIGMA_g13177.t1 [Chlamydomonas eustigma]|eukprot:GAX85762.1 hypothetical protein CEUSTIGMA_g13177.t1 [Chlamydomonas eustigma]
MNLPYFIPETQYVADVCHKYTFPMDFSETYKCSGPQPTFSPDGRYVAAAVEYRLVIRDAETLAVVQLYSCLDRIDHFQWSPNSMYILCGLFSRAIIQIWSAVQADWTCKIDEGPAGVQAATWSPDGTAVVLTASFHIRTTVWSLKDRHCHYLPGSKSGATKSIDFSPCGLYMAQLERYDCHDHISIYLTSSWDQQSHFRTATSDAVDLSWSPDGTCLAVMDGPLYCKVAIHVTDGRILAEHQELLDGLGIKCMSWDSSGQFLALGGYDERLRILDNVTWQPLLDEKHPISLTGPRNPGVVLYREVEEDVVQCSPTSHNSVTVGSLSLMNKSPSRVLKSETRSRYLLCELPAHLPHKIPDKSTPNPRMGIGVIRWSPDGRYLATTSEVMPQVVWVWDLEAGQLGTVLQHASEVTDFDWAPSQETSGASVSLLAIVAQGSKLYMWASAGASVVHIPLKDFQAQKLAWAPGGLSFILTSKDCFSCAYLATAAHA